MNPTAIAAAQQALAQFDSHQNTLSGIALRAADRLSARSNPDPEEEQDLEGVIAAIEFADNVVATLRNFMIAETILTPGVSAITSHVVDTNKNPSNLKTAATILLPNMIGSFVGHMYVKHTVKSALKDAGIDNAQVTQEIEKTSILDMYSLENIRKVKEFYAKADEVIEIIERMKAAEGITNDESVTAIKAFVGSLRNVVTIFLISLGVSVVSGVGAAYHGYKRNNDNLGYALPWLFTGTSGLAVALTQGYAKPLK